MSPKHVPVAPSQVGAGSIFLLGRNVEPHALRDSDSDAKRPNLSLCRFIMHSALWPGARCQLCVLPGTETLKTTDAIYCRVNGITGRWAILCTCRGLSFRNWQTALHWQTALPSASPETITEMTRAPCATVTLAQCLRCGKARPRS